MTESEVTEEYTAPSTEAPPPYSRSRSSILQLSNLRDPTAAEESSKISSLQLVMVASSNDNWSSTPYECACVIEERFLLLGYSEGIQVLDLTDPVAKPRTIIWVRARQMIVIESSRAVLILAGRYKQVRCYSLDALLRLIYAILNLDWSKRRDKQFDVPYLQMWQQLAFQSGKSPDEQQSNNTMGLREIFGKRKEEKCNNNNTNMMKNNVVLMGTVKPFYSCNNVSYQDYYYKLPESKDALSIHTYQTSTYIFASIAHRDKIVLWQKKREHHIQPFHRLKVFWIPTEAKAVSFADDRITLRHIIAVFSNEATAIDLRDSKVETVPIDASLERIYINTWVRDQYEHQLGSPRSPNSPIPTLPTSSTSFPTLPASFSVPPIQWTFLNQLPFYPDNLPATTLTTEYSIPPSYSTVITSLGPPDPVALPSAAAPQLFFATLAKQSYIIDLSGSLFSTQVYRWTEVPNHIEFIQLDGDWCVVGFGPETVEIISIKSAQSIQRVMHGVPVKFLGRWDITNGKKQEYKSLVWTCAASDRVHVYMLNK